MIESFPVEIIKLFLVKMNVFALYLRNVGHLLRAALGLAKESNANEWRRCQNQRI